ncbi:MAG: hypothetical protein ACREEN_01555 [Stellaceae bacterium]
MSDGILALDLATVTGWAHGFPGAVPVSGSVRIGREGSSVEVFLSAFYQWLDETLARCPARIFIFEAPFIRDGRTSGDTARKLQSLAGIAGMLAYDRGFPPERICEADSVQVCKAFTGRGHFKGDRDRKKLLVMNRCRELGWEPTDNDAADALALFRFAESKFYPNARQVERLAV